jgi:hypothetical protein
MLSKLSTACDALLERLHSQHWQDAGFYRKRKAHFAQNAHSAKIALL